MQSQVLDRKLTTSAEAARAYRAGRYAEALALDPTFALAHAALALMGDGGAPVDLCARLRDAELHARRSSVEEREQVASIARYLRLGDIIER
ncbi:MAG: hypothetical protein ACJ72O_16515 [Marmoricola sp.]